MNSFEELCVQVSHNIDAKEQRIRSRTEQEQARFNYAVSYLLIDLWKKHFTHKDYNSSIQKNKNYYSALQIYRDPNLTYRMVIQAFDGLQKLNLIQVTKEGHYDHIKMEGSLTRFKATGELSEMFDQLDGHPAITLKPNLNANTIFLRNIVDGKRTLVSYSEDKDTELWRDNLKKINTCFSQHMIDLRIKDENLLLFPYQFTQQTPQKRALNPNLIKNI